jgi:hypothetical protein
MKSNQFWATLIWLILACSNLESRHPTLEGLWYFVEADGTYWEWVITDHTIWNYNDLTGSSNFRYEVRESTIKRYYPDTNNEFFDLEIETMGKDSIVLVGLNNFRFTLLHINAQYNWDALIEGEQAEMDKYVSHFRKRQIIWEEGRKSNIKRE